MPNVLIQTPRGQMPCYLAVPPNPKPVPGVVVLHDVGGMSQDHRNQADWLAEASFLALAVDLYYLGGTEPYFDEDVSKSRALFENLFESSPDAIVEANREGLIVRINAQVESMFGYTRGELIGQPVNILVPERFRAAHITHQQSYHAAPHTRPMGVGLELYGRRKDGSEFPIDIMLSTLQAEGESLALAVVRDVTQRKQAEVALRRSEEQFRSIVNSVEDYAIFLLDADGRITTWNPGAERIKGYRAEEIIGRDVESFYTEEDVARGKPREALRLAASLGRYEDESLAVVRVLETLWFESESQLRS